MHETPEDLQNRELAAARLSREGRKYFKFVEFDANEKLVSEIRKHPFGLFLILLTGAFVILAIFAITALVLSINLNTALDVSELNDYKPVLAIVSGLAIAGSAIMMFIAAFLYVSNVIYVTSEKLAQVLYVSLFNRKISQLSIGDVQDVTVTQKGIFATVFNYGTLVIETAGEQQNYTFNYVPDPFNQSKMIVSAHEKNLVEYGN